MSNLNSFNQPNPDNTYEKQINRLHPATLRMLLLAAL